MGSTACSSEARRKASGKKCCAVVLQVFAEDGTVIESFIFLFSAAVEWWHLEYCLLSGGAATASDIANNVFAYRGGTSARLGFDTDKRPRLPDISHDMKATHGLPSSFVYRSPNGVPSASALACTRSQRKKNTSRLSSRRRRPPDNLETAEA